MDAVQSVGLEQAYLAHPEHLVAQCWVCITYLSPDTVNQVEPKTCHYVRFIAGRVVYMPPGTLCDCIMAIIGYSNAAVPFVGAAFPAF